jgi:tetratricopeptide (TPR) repeat protein
MLAAAMAILLACGQTPDPGKQVQALLEKGGKHFQKQEYDLAIASYQKALDREPKSAVPYNLLGMAYRFKYLQSRNQDLKAKEIAAFQKAIEIDPQYWVAMINLGATYYQMGEKAKAAPLFKKALELNPSHREKLELLRMIKEGEPQAAPPAAPPAPGPPAGESAPEKK